MKRTSYLIFLIFVALLAGGLVAAVPASAQHGPPPPGYGRDDADAPPRWYNDAQRQGFRDGLIGARKDYGNHRQPDVNNRWEYLNPHMPPELWEPYREGFRRGYTVSMSRLLGGAAPGRWDVIPSAYNQIQRRGFLDGMEGARKDYGNHRRPDVNNRDEFRHPDDVPRDLWGAYREAFRRGYSQTMSHLLGDSGPN